MGLKMLNSNILFFILLVTYFANNNASAQYGHLSKLWELMFIEELKSQKEIWMLGRTFKLIIDGMERRRIQASFIGVPYIEHLISVPSASMRQTLCWSWWVSQL